MGRKDLDAARETRTFPSVPLSRVPAVTVEQMREVDRIAIEDLSLLLLQMMENAGRALAELSLARFHPEAVTVLAGRGGNGGGALAAARHLGNRGLTVTVSLSGPAEEYGGAAGHQLRILSSIGIPVRGEPEEADLIVDGLIGYSLRGAPKGHTAALIRWANESGLPVLSLDLPSGLDADTGTLHEPCIRATATLTLALPKQGLRFALKAVVGELYLADISIPASVFDRLGIGVPPLFAASDIVRLTRETVRPGEE